MQSVCVSGQRFLVPRFIANESQNGTISSGSFGDVLLAGSFAVKRMPLKTHACIEAALRELWILLHFSNVFPLHSRTESYHLVLPPCPLGIWVEPSSSVPPKAVYVLLPRGNRSLKACFEPGQGHRSGLERAHVLLCVAASLATLHAAGVSHRDVKPANIISSSPPLLDPQGPEAPWQVWHLIDFGATRAGFLPHLCKAAVHGADADIASNEPACSSTAAPTCSNNNTKNTNANFIADHPSASVPCCGARFVDCTCEAIRFGLTTGDEVVPQRYRPPEVAAESEFYDGRAVDMWGLGCIGYETVAAADGGWDLNIVADVNNGVGADELSEEESTSVSTSFHANSEALANSGSSALNGDLTPWASVSEPEGSAVHHAFRTLQARVSTNDLEANIFSRLSMKSPTDVERAVITNCMKKLPYKRPTAMRVIEGLAAAILRQHRVSDIASSQPSLVSRAVASVTSFLRVAQGPTRVATVRSQWYDAGYSEWVHSFVSGVDSMTDTLRRNPMPQMELAYSYSKPSTMIALLMRVVMASRPSACLLPGPITHSLPTTTEYMKRIGTISMSQVNKRSYSEVLNRQQFLKGISRVCRGALQRRGGPGGPRVLLHHVHGANETITGHTCSSCGGSHNPSSVFFCFGCRHYFHFWCAGLATGPMQSAQQFCVNCCTIFGVNYPEYSMQSDSCEESFAALPTFSGETVSSHEGPSPRGRASSVPAFQALPPITPLLKSSLALNSLHELVAPPALQVPCTGAALVASSAAAARITTIDNNSTANRGGALLSGLSISALLSSHLAQPNCTDRFCATDNRSDIVAASQDIDISPVEQTPFTRKRRRIDVNDVVAVR